MIGPDDLPRRPRTERVSERLGWWFGVLLLGLIGAVCIQGGLDELGVDASLSGCWLLVVGVGCAVRLGVVDR